MTLELDEWTLKSADRSLSVSRFGGRILSFCIHNRNVLLDSGIQTGSTFWPAPQVLWQWPPPPVLDHEPYSIISRSSRHIDMCSGIDSALGIQLHKSFSLQKMGARLEYTIHNVSADIVTMAPWEISRVPGGLTFYAAASKPEAQSTCAAEYAAGHYWYAYQPRGLTGIPKIFANRTDGWLANVHNRQLFLKRFPSVAVDEVAPSEAEVEIYAHADTAQPYVEVEQQGPFKAILPDRRLHWTVEWILAEVPARVDVSVGSPGLLDLVYELLESSSKPTERARPSPVF